MSNTQSTINDARATVISEPAIVEVAEVSAAQSSTVSTISQNDSDTLIETSRVELISIAQPQNDTLTLIQEDAQQTVIETKQIEIIEIEVPCCGDDLKNPVFTYTGDFLTGILYDDGSAKVLSYLAGGQLDTITFTSNDVTVLKQFNYDNQDRLISINETQV